MTELLFFVTIIFVAYAVYAALSNPSRSASASVKQTPVQEAKPEAVAEVKESAAEPKAAESKSEPAPVVETAESAEAKQPGSAEKAANSIRDPKTGEVVTIPANYRFAKRWIKDALVEEGLLDKVYKNSELDDAASAKVKHAIEVLKSMEKYQA